MSELSCNQSSEIIKLLLVIHIECDFDESTGLILMGKIDSF